jgi:DNA-binding NarL/FixJ family response regulator
MQAEESAAAVAVAASVRASFLVVDQDREFAERICELLRLAGHVTLTAASGEEALLTAREHRPLVVLIETHLPGLNGYEVCRALRDEYGRDIAIAFVSGSRTDVADVSAGLIVGADDYLAKPCDPGELMARAGALLRRVRPDAPAAAARPAGGLTRRELEILALLARGLSQREIAAELTISSSTVARHIEHVLAKLDVHSRAQAVAAAYRLGLLDPSATTDQLAARDSNAPPALAGQAPDQRRRR